MPTNSKLRELEERRKKISETLKEKYPDANTYSKLQYVQGRGWKPRPKPSELRELESELRSLNEQEEIIKQQERAKVIAQEHRGERKEARREARQELEYAKQKIRRQPERNISEAERKGKLLEEYEQKRRRYAEAGLIRQPRPKPEYREKEQYERVYSRPSSEDYWPEKQAFVKTQREKFREEFFRKQAGARKKKAEQITDYPITQFVKEQRRQHREALAKQAKGKTEKELLEQGIIRRTTRKDVSIAPVRYAYTEKAMRTAALATYKKKAPMREATIGAASRETWGTEQILVGTRGGGAVPIGKHEAETQDKSISYPKEVLTSGVRWAFEKKESPEILTKAYEKISRTSKGWFEVARTTQNKALKGTALGLGTLTAGSARMVGTMKTVFEHPTETALTIAAFGAGSAAIKAVAGETASTYAAAGTIAGLSAGSYLVSPPKTTYEAVERAWDVPILVGAASAFRQTPVLARKAKQTIYKEVEVKRMFKAEIVSEVTVGKELTKKQQVRLYESEPAKTRVLGSVGRTLRKLGFQIKGRVTMPKPQKTINVKYQRVLRVYPSSGGRGIYAQKGEGKLIRRGDNYDFIPTKQPELLSYVEISKSQKKPAAFKLSPPRSYFEQGTISVKGYTYTRRFPSRYVPTHITIGKSEVPISFVKKIEGGTGAVGRSSGIEGQIEGASIEIKRRLPSMIDNKKVSTEFVIGHELGHILDHAKQGRFKLFTSTGKLPKHTTKEIENLINKRVIRKYPALTREFEKEIVADLLGVKLTEPKLFSKVAPKLNSRIDVMLEQAKIPPMQIMTKKVKQTKTVMVSPHTRQGKFKVYSGRDLTVREETIKRNNGVMIGKSRLIETAKTEAIPIKKPRRPRAKRKNFFNRAIKRQGAVKLDLEKLVQAYKSPIENAALFAYKQKGIFGGKTKWGVIERGIPDARQKALLKLKHPEPMKAEQRTAISKPITSVKTVKIKSGRAMPFYIPMQYGKTQQYYHAEEVQASFLLKRYEHPPAGLKTMMPTRYSHYSHKHRERMMPILEPRERLSPTTQISFGEMEGTKPVSSIREAVKQRKRQFPITEVFSIETTKERSMAKPVSSIREAVKQRKKQLQALLNLEQPFPTLKIPEMLAEPPLKPTPLRTPPIFKLQKIRASQFKMPKAKRKKKFRPTIFSIITGYAGKEIKLGEITGLGLRPLRM